MILFSGEKGAISVNLKHYMHQRTQGKASILLRQTQIAPVSSTSCLKTPCKVLWQISPKDELFSAVRFICVQIHTHILHLYSACSYTILFKSMLEDLV